MWHCLCLSLTQIVHVLFFLIFKKFCIILVILANFSNHWNWTFQFLSFSKITMGDVRHFCSLNKISWMLICSRKIHELFFSFFFKRMIKYYLSTYPNLAHHFFFILNYNSQTNRSNFFSPHLHFQFQILKQKPLSFSYAPILSNFAWIHEFFFKKLCKMYEKDDSLHFMTNYLQNIRNFVCIISYLCEIWRFDF